MAEAAVENMSRYFCHQCSRETNPVLPEYTCPVCRTGFIEEVVPDDEDSIDHVFDDSEPEQLSQADNRHFVDFLENLYGRLNTPTGQTSLTTPNQGTSSSSTDQDPSDRSLNESGPQRQPRRSARTRLVQLRFPQSNEQGSAPFDPQQTIEGIFHQLLTNVAGGQNSRDAGRSGFINIDFPLFHFLHGHPGDYAWGSGGLDAVITQLLNQLDGTGPPPMPKEEIDSIPTVQITQDQVDKNVQCTVCMEDFKLGENVRQIACSHCYHNECIVPWLKLHATCPICRKPLNDGRLNGTNQRNRSNSQPGTSNRNQFGGGGLNYEFPEDYD